MLLKKPSNINESFKHANTKKTRGGGGSIVSGLTTIFTKKIETSKITHSLSEEDDETQF